MYRIYEEEQWLQIFVLCMVILAGLWFYRRMFSYDKQEGFEEQSASYVSKNKECDEIYDGFYISKYDDLYRTDAYSENDYNVIVNVTLSKLSNPTFLDIGCGTGSLLKRLEEDGFSVFGIDKSRAMVEQAQTNLHRGEVIQDDVLRDPMLYENDRFSHILCTHFTVYEIENKQRLFRQCFHWLRSGGFFVVHIIEPEYFNMITPKSDLYSHIHQQDTRITKTVIEMPEFMYTNSYVFGNPNDSMTQIEKFEGRTKVRQNEKQLYMMSKEDIYSLALQCGFQVYAETNYSTIEDKHQYIVIFLKPMCGPI